jgi:hypothetical protein
MQVDPSVVTEIDNFLTSQGYGKYTVIVPSVLLITQFLLQTLVMPHLTPAETTSPLWYRWLYSVISKFTMNIGKNKPVPNSMLKNPR